MCLNKFCIIILVLLLSLLVTLIQANNSILRCSVANSEWIYCVDGKLRRRNWYDAMAECRGYGGELVAFEWPDKVKNIQQRMNDYDVDLSKGLFVNAHSIFYSGTEMFTWRSGVGVQLESKKREMEKCVYYSQESFSEVTCNTYYALVPLLCQRVFQKLDYTTNLDTLLSYAENKETVLFGNDTISSSLKICNYFTFLIYKYNVYQAKHFCESFDSELLGIPENEECQIVAKVVTDSKNPQVFLNVHLYMYAKNNFSLIFRDPYGLTLSDSECTRNWSKNTKLTGDNEKYCIMVEKKLAQDFKCEHRYPSKCSGFICKQCRPKQIINTSKITEHITPAITPLPYQMTSPASCSCLIYQVIAFVIGFLVVIIVILLVALFFFIRRNRLTAARDYACERQDQLIEKPPFMQVCHNTFTEYANDTENLICSHESHSNDKGIGETERRRLDLSDPTYAKPEEFPVLPPSSSGDKGAEVNMACEHSQEDMPNMPSSYMPNVEAAFRPRPPDSATNAGPNYHIYSQVIRFDGSVGGTQINPLTSGSPVAPTPTSAPTPPPRL